MRPLRGLQETRVATREESGVLGFPSRRGLSTSTSLVMLAGGCACRLPTVIRKDGMYRATSIFPGSASGKELICQCRRRKRPGFDPWVRKIPWRRKQQPTPVFLPGKSHGQRSLEGSSPWGHKELDMTERLNSHHILAQTFSDRRKCRCVWARESTAPVGGPSCEEESLGPAAPCPLLPRLDLWGNAVHARAWAQSWSSAALAARSVLPNCTTKKAQTPFF